MGTYVYLACAPRGAGVTLALLYSARGTGVNGWYAREHDRHAAAAFFALDNAHPATGTILRRSADDDVYGKWIEETVPVTTGVRCPLSESDCNELSRLRTAFCREWLFFADDPGDRDEVEMYRELGLPVRPLNVRSTQFRRFDRNRAIWVYAAPGIDLDLVLYLKERLPADRRDAMLPT